MQPNRYIHLSPEEIETLEEGVKHHLKFHFRTRCECLLLSHQGYKVVEIAKLLEVRTHTVRFWMDNWEQQGIVGLQIRPGRGRKLALPLTNPAFLEDLQTLLRLNPQSLAVVALEMSKKWNCLLSKESLQRFIKKSSITAGVDFGSV
jgi:transposase